MRVISFIEDPDVIQQILKHLGLWNVKRKPRPVANAPPIDVFPAYDEQPGPSADNYIMDPSTLPTLIFKLFSQGLQGSYA